MNMLFQFSIKLSGHTLKINDRLATDGQEKVRIGMMYTDVKVFTLS